MTNIDVKYLYGIYEDEVKNRECSTLKEFIDTLESKIEDMIREGEIA